MYVTLQSFMFGPKWDINNDFLPFRAYLCTTTIGIVSLPFAFRPVAAALTAMDVTVLSEAARSLGASWWTVTWRVLLPNLRRGISAACFLTITVVLGEWVQE